MDLSIHSLLPLLLPLLSTVGFLLVKILRGGRNRDAALPPGNNGWPIIGESFEFTQDPKKFIRSKMKNHSDARVFKTSLFGENMAVFCGDSGNKFLFSNENKLVTSWWPQSIATVFALRDGSAPDEQFAIKARSFFLEFLKPEFLRDYVAIMDRTAKRHLEAEWLPYKEVKVYPLTKTYTLELSCKLFMKIDGVTNLADPFDHVTTGLISMPINIPGTKFSRAVNAGKIIHAEVLAVVNRRKAELIMERTEIKTVSTTTTTRADLVTRMLMTRDENDKFLSEGQIASMILGLLIASHETTSSVITFIVSYLADLPHIYKEVFQEQMEIASAKAQDEALTWDDIQKMKYSWNVANEVMRLAPPAQGAYREALQDFTYAGFTIPKGWKTHWSVHSTHRNPKYFPDPEKFDPSRFEGKGPVPYSFVPFGGGPRMCPGREFGRLEILTFMHNLVTKFRWKKKLPNEEITYTTSPVPLHGLPIYLLPHHPHQL